MRISLSSRKSLRLLRSVLSCVAVVSVCYTIVFYVTFAADCNKTVLYCIVGAPPVTYTCIKLQWCFFAIIKDTNFYHSIYR